MEMLLMIAVIVISQLLGFFIGNVIWKLISNFGSGSSEIGSFISSIFLACFFLSMVVAFWQIGFEFVPQWFLITCKIVLTINVSLYIMVIVGRLLSGKS